MKRRETYLDGKVSNVEGVERFNEDTEDFRVGNHGVKVSGNIKVLRGTSATPRLADAKRTHALVKLPHTALGHGRLIPSVYFSDVVPLDGRIRALVHRQEPGERHSQVVPQTAELSTLILQVIDQFRVLSVFPREDILEFKDGGIDRTCSVLEEDVLEG